MATMAAGRVATGSVTGAAGSPAIERSSGELGVTVAARGTTPALRMRERTSAAWAWTWMVITVPAAPARAVRPERCRYALCSAGGSA